MNIQINTNIGHLKRNNAIENLKNQMKNIQVNQETKENLDNINEKKPSSQFSNLLNSKLTQLDKERENLIIAKNKLASVENKLKSIQSELNQVSGPTPDLSGIAQAIKIIGSESDSNIEAKNNSGADINNETDIDNVLGNLNKLEQKLDSKDKFLTYAKANSQASLSRLAVTDMTMKQLNKKISD